MNSFVDSANSPEELTTSPAPHPQSFLNSTTADADARDRMHATPFR